VPARFEAEKGAALTDFEAATLAERTAAARAWLDAYAPDRARLEVQRDHLPLAATELDGKQRVALASLATGLATATAWDGESLQAAIFDAARVAELPAGRIFAALYLAFLGHPSGPRAGWLLASLPADFVVERLRAAASTDTLIS
jgi:lysyl-tRNA synthetase class 1